MNAVLQDATALAVKVSAVATDVASRNIGREALIRATLLSLVSGRPAFFLGTPGINKTGTVQDIAQAVEEAEMFDALMPTIVSVEQLLVESTSIEETPTAQGGKSIATRDTLGRAASAHIVFADEIWKAEPRVLQTLLDLSKGDGVRHEGQLVKTPLMAFIAASNELPDPEGNLGAMWSRMTIRAVVNSLDRGGKKALVTARLNRARGTGAAPDKLTLAEVETLRAARPMVEVDNSIVEIVLDLYQELLDADNEGFQWLWDDDRRFGRVFDVLQAAALLEGRDRVSKTDLRVLELLLWDTPEQIALVREKIAPLCRTPLTEANELVESLLAVGGVVAEAKNGNRDKIVPALTQFEEAINALGELVDDATGAEKAEIEQILARVEQEKLETVTAATGMRITRRR